VAKTNGDAGEVATANTVIASILPLVALQIKVNVSEDNIVNVKTGQRVDIELDAFGGDSHFFGTVTQIDPQQTIVGGAVYYQATVVFDQNYEGILPGMTANVTITTATKNNVLLAPASALQQIGGKYYAQVLKEKTAIQTMVQAGISGASSVEIISGLADGDQVVTGNK
jgi:multidrug efflux pump subunit AcrA (membrane-fusion protein)